MPAADSRDRSVLYTFSTAVRFNPSCDVASATSGDNVRLDLVEQPERRREEEGAEGHAPAAEAVQQIHTKVSETH